MTDETAPAGPSTTMAPADPPAQAEVLPPGGQPPGAPPAAGGRLRPVIIIGALIALIAVILFLVRNNVEADGLKVGECFDVPNGTTVMTVEKHPCEESHMAEVIFVGEYADGTTFPISLTLDRYIDTNCVPAFESYVGRSWDSEPELSIGYFHPTTEGWDDGERTITCYVAQPDGSPMTESLKS